MQGLVLLQGIVIGFSIAAPVGPIGVLCIRRTLAHGKRAGLASGFGAATADAFYGAVAALGLTFVSTTLLGQRDWLGLVGGGYLCVLGIRTFLSVPSDHAAETHGSRFVSAYLSTLLLTITNPVTIVSFAAVFAGIGLATGDTYGTASLLVLGVFAGSMFWWSLLVFGVGLMRGRVSIGALRAVNRFSGIVLAVFGVVALAGRFLS